MNHNSVKERALLSQLYWRCCGHINTATTLAEKCTFERLAAVLWLRLVRCQD